VETYISATGETVFNCSDPIYSMQFDAARYVIIHRTQLKNFKGSLSEILANYGRSSKGFRTNDRFSLAMVADYAD
jgi:hypothetical protein